MWENVIGISNEQAGTNQGVEALINAPTVSAALSPAEGRMPRWRARCTPGLGPATVWVMEPTDRWQLQTVSSIVCMCAAPHPPHPATPCPPALRTDWRRAQGGAGAAPGGGRSGDGHWRL